MMKAVVQSAFMNLYNKSTFFPKKQEKGAFCTYREFEKMLM